MNAKFLFFITTLLCVLGNRAFAQIEIDEQPANPVGIGGLKTAYYNKCTGKLYINLQTSFDAGNIFPIHKAYVYIKMGGQWKNMLTIRGEDSWDDNGGNGSNCQNRTNWFETYEPAYDQVVVPGPNGPGFPCRRVAGNMTTCPPNSYPYDNTSGYIDPGHVKRRIGYYNGADGHSSWFSYEDEGLCNIADGFGNPGANNIAFEVNGNPPFIDWGHSTGISNHLLPICVYPTAGAGGAWALQMGIRNVPQAALVGNNIQIRVYVNYRNNGTEWMCNDAPNNRYETYEYAVPIQVPDAPLGLTATTNQCGQVTLNWSNPTQTWSGQLNCTSFQDYNYEIYRDGVKIGFVIADDATSFVDNTPGLVVGQTYQYSVKTFLWNEGGYGFRVSSSSNIATGSMKMPPAIATNFKASDDKCNGEIVLNWNQDAQNLDRYDLGIYDGNSWSTIFNISGNSRSHTRTFVPRGVNMLYHLYAVNSCGYNAGGPAITNGISPVDPAMATNVTATTNTVTNTIDITWQDNAINETKYEIVRTDDIGNTILTQVNANQTSYTDNAAASCRLYTYKVRAYNGCVLSGITSISQAQATLPPPNLGNTFDATHKLTASKGYFSNRVELSWGNNNGLNVDVFKIYRKQLGTNLDSVQIAAPNAGSGLYVDNTADARVFYRYTIVGVKSCNGSDLLTNISSDIGFRNPTGLVSGHIEYNGGIAVNGAKVFVQQSTPTLLGNSLKFNPAGFMTIVDDPKLEPGAQMRCEFWLKPISLPMAGEDFINKPNSYFFGYNGTVWYWGIFIGGSLKFVDVPTSAITLNNWNHVSVVYNGSVLKLLINGVLVDSTPATGSIDDSNSNLVFGNANTNFYLDEFRLIGQSVADSIIKIDANRVLNGDETAFKCNLHFNENVGSYAYDVSKVGNFFNANHAAITNTNVVWSSDIPTQSQLGYFGVTDALGNYVVTGIQYLGSGENFNLVPNYQTHQFSPNSRSVYIGDATNVFNNQDFLDISSFLVTGTLFYKNTTCPVPDAILSIDGLAVVKNGENVKTDANGTFSVSVPIGNHYVSIAKQFHDMENGRYPLTGTHNFQTPVSGIQFTDSTKVTLVGRIVGGLIEKEKAPGMGRSINNIGQAKLGISTPLTGTPCYFKTVITNSLTGEYIMRVPPMTYKIDTAFVITNSVVIGKSNLSNTNNVLDLTNALTGTTVVDTLFDSNGGVVSVDSINYNKRLDFIYRNAPIVDVTNLNEEKLHGEDTLYVGTIKLTIKPKIGNLGSYGWGPMNWPLYLQGKTYFTKVHANEIYTNTDNGVKDTVPLSGNISITNQLVNGSDPNANFSFKNGVGTYSFVCGSPNTASLSGTPDLSYTKDIQVVVVPDGAASVPWHPNQTISPANKNFHAIIVGKRTTGTGLATQGPEKVDFILRDPPGSGSSATWSTGNSISKSSSFGTNFSSEVGMDATVSSGVSQYVGLGVSTKVEVENNLTLGLNVTTNYNNDNTITETISSNFAVSTRDDADNVGTPADIFIGRSRNWLMGPTTNIEIIDAAKCNGRCFGPVFNGKSLAKTVGFTIDPDGIRTRFAYTKNEIETVVIPTLEAMRNSILVSRPYYTVIAAPTHSLFGSNNDDPLWGAAKTSTNPEIYDDVDTTGSSYVFRGLAKFKTDTVRILNSQIAIWKRTLAQNEREKYLAKTSTNTGTVIPNPNFASSPFTEPPTLTIYPPMLQDNFTLGSAVIANSYQVDNEESGSETYEVAINETLAIQIGAEFGGVGVHFSPHVSFTEGFNRGSSTTNVVSNAIEYTLTDGDPGDVMSVDVYRYGLSNIFITRGGQTMCPYEDAVVFNYYDPNNSDAWIGSHNYNASGSYTLSNATIQREMPNISITPAIQYNIPSNQAAVYQLVLSNQSPLTVNNDVDLQVRVDGANNPNGAVCKIDGQNANNIYTIPSGGSLIKTLTIERGPIEIEYDSLMVIFSSACSEDIADTAYVSVHFIPTCTDLSINTPVDNFIINNNNNSIQNVIIDDYNYNYGSASNTSTLTGTAHPSFGLEKIGYEFKPANSSQWLQVQDFYKEVAAAQAAGTNTIYSIPQGQVYTQYSWSVTPQAYADGNYEIRAVSYCYNKDGSYAVKYSPVHEGVMDRVNPHPFGTPSPGDGILDPNDDISIQFNEQIDISSLSYAPVTNTATGNFDIRGVLNGENLRHSESLMFDGTADYAEVAGGVSLQKRPFTFEFWAKFNPTGIEQTIISQGTDPIQKMIIEFDASSKLKFTLGNQTVLSTNPVGLPSDWHHYAISYDYQNADASLYIDGAFAGINNNFIVDYIGSGKLVFGKAISTNNNFFNGSVHELRLWNKTRSISEISLTMNTALSRNQSGLVYNWKMDEADGAFAKDDIRSRNADIYGATWEVNPNGNAVQLDGVDDHIQISSSTIAINKEMDFTLEFWFNSNQAGVATLFSNGAGAANAADSLTAWSIQKDATGKIHVHHKGLDFVAVNTNFFDGNWHHFALVMNRSANLSAYIDGNLQNSVQGINFHNFASSYIYLGAKATVAGASTSLSDYYSGKMDEFRLWNMARKTEQLKRDKQNRMLGDEAGLLAFVPFESYALVLGTPSLTPTFNNQSTTSLTVNAVNGTSLIAQTPTIKLPRPVQTVNYSWSLNNDKIILTTTTAPELIENVTLDVTVQNAYDMHGNKMQSPKTWISYINKNQVKWQDDEFTFNKNVDSVITFTAPIVNTGGATKAFTIDGLPSWITANVTSGNISPNSTQNIVFTIPAGTSIGEYSADISLTTDFNYAELLLVNLTVKGTAPSWTVNPSNYQYSMNAFAQLKVDNVMLANAESKIAAFKNNVLCGVSNLQYVSAYDKYMAFLNIYNNNASGDSIKFKIYDASTGITFVNVTPSIVFNDNQILGTVSNPAIFSATTEVELNIPLNTGWTWVSLPLKSNKLASSNALLSSVGAINGDVVMSDSKFDQFAPASGWLGTLTQSGGYKNNQSYKIKVSSADTLVHTGARIHPDSAIATINLQSGWNWMSYVSTKTMLLSQALGNYNAITGDVIKSQFQFAYYDNLVGWTGSLTHMSPGIGYMLSTSTASSFNYPLTSFLGKMMDSNPEPIKTQIAYDFKPELFYNTMSVIVKGNICNESLAQGKVVIGAFDKDNKLRGFAYPTLNAKNNYDFYLSLYSNTNNEQLNLNYFNTETGEQVISERSVTFITDGIIGKPSEPITANVTEAAACRFLSNNTTTEMDGNVIAYPNPFVDNFTISFGKKSNCVIEITDVLGKVIYSTSCINKKEVTIDANKLNTSAGIYYIRLTGDVNTQQKIVKLK